LNNYTLIPGRHPTSSTAPTYPSMRQGHGLPLGGLLVGVIAVSGPWTVLGAADASDLGSDTNPVIVHKLPPGFFDADGKTSKWPTITALPAPFSHKTAGMLRLGWTDDGLFGSLEATDATIAVDAFGPWTKDCLELWLETDAARSYDMSDHSYQIALAPNPDAGAGRAIVIAASGPIPADRIDAHWRPMPGGYALEFFVPAAQLKVAFHDGLTLGMNYAVDDKGIAIEEFYHDKDMDSGFCSPYTWGMIALKP
jgi:hypothetical protein